MTRLRVPISGVIVAGLLLNAGARSADPLWRGQPEPQWKSSIPRETPSALSPTFQKSAADSPMIHDVKWIPVALPVQPIWRSTPAVTPARDVPPDRRIAAVEESRPPQSPRTDLNSTLLTPIRPETMLSLPSVEECRYIREPGKLTLIAEAPATILPPTPLSPTRAVLGAPTPQLP